MERERDWRDRNQGQKWRQSNRQKEKHRSDTERMGLMSVCVGWRLCVFFYDRDEVSKSREIHLS